MKQPSLSVLALFLAVVALVATVSGADEPAPVSQPAGTPRRVVFILDASGSMVTELNRAKSEVRKAIEALDPDQSFGLVVAARDKKLKFQAKLFPATPQNKRRAYDHMEKLYATGESDMSAAFEPAFRLRPDVIWFASDGDVVKDEKAATVLLKRLRNLNRGQRARVNTVLAFVDGDQENGLVDRVTLLWRIANENGGQCLGDGGEPVDAPPDSVAEARGHIPKAATGKDDGSPSVFSE